MRTKPPLSPDHPDEIVATATDFDENGALTREFLLRRGRCCQEGCRNCPYGFRSGTKAPGETVELS